MMKGRIPLSRCLVDDANGEQLRKYGISEADLARHRVLTHKREQRLCFRDWPMCGRSAHTGPQCGRVVSAVEQEGASQ